MVIKVQEKVVFEYVTLIKVKVQIYTRISVITNPGEVMSGRGGGG